jgi:hypothetical protein
MRSHTWAADAALRHAAVVAVLAVLLAACSSTDHRQANTHPPTTNRATAPPTAPTTTPAKVATAPPGGALYDWTRGTGPAVADGSKPSSTLADVLAPSAGADGLWTAVGTRSSGTGTTSATVWTSPDASTWSATALTGALVDSTASGAVLSGTETIVVGSIGSGQNQHAAVWISPRRGAGFQIVTDPTLATPGTSMESVAVGDLGLFAVGSADNRVAMWYSSTGRAWTQLTKAQDVIDRSGDAHVDTLLVTVNAVYAGGWYRAGSSIDAGLWSSQDGLNWHQIGSSQALFGGPGDHLITGLTPYGTGLLAVGGSDSGLGWQATSWVSPNGVSWSAPSTGFVTAGSLAPGGPEAIVRAVTSPNPDVLSTPASPPNPAAASFVAVGGGPTNQEMWRSTDGVRWSEVPLPGSASATGGWQATLVAARGSTTVVADAAAGQPHLLVQRGATWEQPSANPATFGSVASAARPTGLVAGPGDHLVLSIATSQPDQGLGRATAGVELFSSTDGMTWARLPTGNVFAASDLRALGSTEPSTRGDVTASSGPSAGSSGSSGGSGDARQVATLPAQIIAVGSQHTGATTRASAWLSADGTSWARTTSLDPASAVVDDVANGTCASEHQVVVVGSAHSASPPAAGLSQTTVRAWYSSDDGSTWGVASFPASPSPEPYVGASMEGCRVTGSGFEAYGEATLADGTTVPAYWTSTSGTTWVHATNNPFGSGFPFPAEAVTNGTATRLAVGGAEPVPSWVMAAQPATPSSLWESVDGGTSWLAADPDGTAFGDGGRPSIDEAAWWGSVPVVAGELDGQVAVWTGSLAPATPGSAASAAPTSNARHIPA